MNYSFKIITILFLIFISCTSIQASELDKLVKKIKKDATVGIYIKNEKDNTILFKDNENKPLNPASLLKILTFASSYLVLGDDYEFETSLYQNKKDIYIKLGGDVLLTEENLDNLISNLKTKSFDNIYIDSSIIDKAPYPETWQEEDLWPSTKMVTPYIIDKNMTKISIHRSSLATKVDIIQENDYKLAIINKLKLGDKRKINILREYENNPNIITLEGTINGDVILTIPVLQPEINFNIKLKNSLQKNKIVYTKTVEEKITPTEAQKIASVSHNIKDISKLILHNSDNFASEVVFKVAAAKYINYQKSASLDDAIKMFSSIFKRELDEKTKIADGSGVSEENFISAKTYSKLLDNIFSTTDIKTLLPNANQGTLKERLSFTKDNLKAKTGTLRHSSSLAGSIKTLKNETYTFVIITQDSKKRKPLVKHFEDRIIGTLYKNY